MANFKLRQTGEQIQKDLDKIENDALVKPGIAPSATSILAIDNANAQTMLTVGNGLNVENGALNVTEGTSITVSNVSESTEDGGNNVVTFSDGKTLTVKNGKTGATGATGAAGANGTSVTVSSVSESTADGGENIVTFSDGKALTVKNGSKGSQGVKGDKGDKGETGAAGKDGTDGTPCTHAWNGTTLTVTSASGTSSANLKGERGEQGIKGDKGEKGDPTDVQQTTGQSTTAVMSQKASTDLFALKSDLNTLSLGVYTDGLVYIYINGKPIGTGVEFVKSGDVVGYVDNAKNIVITGALADGTYTIKYENQDGSTTEIGTLVIGSGPSYINLLSEAKSHTDLSTVFNSVGYMNNTRPSSATPFYSSHSGYVTTGCFQCTFDSVFYIKGVTIDTSDSNCRLGFAGVQNNALNPYSVSSSFSNYATLETLGNQYYKVTFNSQYLQTNCPLLAYFFFGGIGSGENLIVSTTPIE